MPMLIVQHQEHMECPPTIFALDGRKFFSDAYVQQISKSSGDIWPEKPFLEHASPVQ